MKREPLPLKHMTDATEVSDGNCRKSGPFSMRIASQKKREKNMLLYKWSTSFKKSADQKQPLFISKRLTSSFVSYREGSLLLTCCNLYSSNVVNDVYDTFENSLENFNVLKFRSLSKYMKSP